MIVFSLVRLSRLLSWNCFGIFPLYMVRRPLTLLFIALLTVQLITDFKEAKGQETLSFPLHVLREAMEVEESLKFLGVTTSEYDVDCQHLPAGEERPTEAFFPQESRSRLNCPKQLLLSFYRSTTEPILTHCATIWHPSRVGWSSPV